MSDRLKLLQGFSAKLNSNKFFELFVVSIIILPALVVGMKTYDISANFLAIIAVLDWVITIIFLIEISIRFIVEEKKSQFFKNA